MIPAITWEGLGLKSETDLILWTLFVETKCKDVMRGRERELAKKHEEELTEAYAEGRADEADDWRKRELAKKDAYVPATLT